MGDRTTAPGRIGRIACCNLAQLLAVREHLVGQGQRAPRSPPWFKVPSGKVQMISPFLTFSVASRSACSAPRRRRSEGCLPAKAENRVQPQESSNRRKNP